MKKILLVANTDWYLYNFRLQLAEMLINWGYQVILVSPPGPYVPQFTGKGLRWIEWKVNRQSLSPLKEINSIRHLAKIFKQEQPDLVHNHTIKAVIYGSLAARSDRSIKVVNSITGRGSIFLDNKPITRFIRIFIKLLYRFCVDHPKYQIIFENGTDQQFFFDQRLLTKSEARIIMGMGVDVKRFVQTPEPKDVPVILYPGRILWEKGIGVLVEAAQLLHQQTKMRLVLAGKPDPGNPSSIPDRQLDTWIRSGILEWWGWQEDMSKIYPQCNVVVLPSFAEGIPTALLEASACGRAVVATDVPGCRDVVQPGMTGLLVPAKDAQALMEALNELITHPSLRQQMGEAGRKMIEDKFSAELINTQTVQLYQEVIP
jgi:glycosyltransferase involved in cell wall biosynthesis